MSSNAVTLSVAAIVTGTYLARTLTPQNQVRHSPSVGLLLMCAGALGIFVSQSVSTSTRSRVDAGRSAARGAQGNVLGRVSLSTEEGRG